MRGHRQGRPQGGSRRWLRASEYPEEEIIITTEQYPRSSRYTDLHRVYSQCSGPGGLQVTEFLAQKMGVQSGDKLLDVGTNKGYQTCFLAKEFGPFVIGIDPWGDSVETLMRNAKDMAVESRVIGIKVGVPDTGFASGSFDKVMSTTTLEMIRGMKGEAGYREALAEIYRVLKPGGIFGLAEPMHRDVAIPEEIYPYVTRGDMPAPWTECFATLEATVQAVTSAGFAVIEAAEAPDAHRWWQEYCTYDPDPGEDREVIAQDNGRWTTYGYVIARR